MHLDGSAVGGGKEWQWKSEKPFDHKNVLFP